MLCEILRRGVTCPERSRGGGTCSGNTTLPPAGPRYDARFARQNCPTFVLVMSCDKTASARVAGGRGPQRATRAITSQYSVLVGLTSSRGVRQFLPKFARPTPAGFLFNLRSPRIYRAEVLCQFPGSPLRGTDNRRNLIHPKPPQPVILRCRRSRCTGVVPA